MSVNRLDFLRAICEDLKDDTSRLVFADWLEEQGDKGAADPIRWGVLHPDIYWCCEGDRDVGLICGPGSRCPTCGGLFDFGFPDELLGDDRYRIRRGFVSEVTCSAGTWLSVADKILWRPGEACRACLGTKTKGWKSVRLSGGAVAIEDTTCPACSGTGRRPMPPTAQPVEEVRLTTWPEVRHTRSGSHHGGRHRVRLAGRTWVDAASLQELCGTKWEWAVRHTPRETLVPALLRAEWPKVEVWHLPGED